MPLVLRGTAYPMPGEAGQPTITGRELVAIEDEFGLDALKLLSVLSGGDAGSGYTQAKAMYAIGWIAVHRADAAMTFGRFLDDVALDEFTITDAENPTEAA